MKGVLHDIQRKFGASLTVGDAEGPIFHLRAAAMPFVGPRK
jgi:hypothetical protein